MTSWKVISITGVVVTVFLCSVMAARQEEDRVPEGTFAGVISKINCEGEIREAGAKELEKKKLKAEADKGRPVASGDCLRCVDAGEIEINQGGAKLLNVKKEWVTIKPSKILASIHQYSEKGAARFSAIPIFSPSVGGAERVRDIVLRWQPTPGMDRVTVNIWSVSTGKKICCDGEYDGRKGVLDLAELRTALSPLREGDEKVRELVLEVRASPLRVARAEFEILSTTQEHELDVQLEEWQRKDKLLTHIGRAHVLLNYRLYSEAEQEWDAALAQEPRSPYLLSPALYAAQLAGNTSRAEELAARLKSSSK